ncbi:MAG: GNAT family N-acetyltransferase, partial [Patescibacteria group bacterium]|nr:GNAT family N-acetyltransferase [Patescibacteria group bacterium]
MSKHGEFVRLELLRPGLHSRLLAMYLAYQPRNCFQGLPPIRDDVCAKWVEDMIRDGASIVALAPGADAVIGHVAIFPVNDRKCELLVVVAPAFQNHGIGTQLV